jgi:hypothetical protein
MVRDCPISKIHISIYSLRVIPIIPTFCMNRKLFIVKLDVYNVTLTRSAPLLEEHTSRGAECDRFIGERKRWNFRSAESDQNPAK